MDMVNYTIQSLQPQLQEHSIQFERAQFQERLNKDPSMYYGVRRERVEGGLVPDFRKGCSPSASSGRMFFFTQWGAGVGEAD